ncbi:hypothetical protein [Bacteroides zhangwenhongii]|uniref:hypothetical protein n=1 Tax=Bacteroides zhangwenhongii TaxID=2650157 RepID=UPI0022E08CA6|nr:hypothetical protein [Bacteroides zhangwenhongii]
MPLSFVAMPRVAFTDIQMIFLFSLSILPEAESMLSVSACSINEADGHTRPGKPVRMNVSARWNKYHRIGNIHTSFVVVCPFHASGDVFFFLWISFFTDFP